MADKIDLTTPWAEVSFSGTVTFSLLIYACLEESTNNCVKAHGKRYVQDIVG